MYSKPSAPRSVAGVIDDGFRLGQAGFSRTWPFAFVAHMLVALPLVSLKMQYGGDLGDPQAMMMAFQSPGFSLLYIGLAWTSVGFQNAITALNASIAEGAPKTMPESLSIGFRLLPRTLLLAVLLVLAFMLVAVCFAIPAIYLEDTGRIILGVLFLFPACYYAGRVFLANPIFLVEDIGAYRSILRSWHLTRGNYWRAIIVLSLLLLMFFVVLIVAGLVTGLVAGFVGIAFGARSVLTMSVVELVSAVANMLFTPFMSAVLLSIYYDVKLRKTES